MVFFQVHWNTVMSCITITNEPGTSVVPVDEVTEHEHNVIPGSCSLTVGPAFLIPNFVIMSFLCIKMHLQTFEVLMYM